MLQHQVGDGVELLVVQVGRDLHKHGPFGSARGGGQAAVLSADRSEELAECICILKTAEAGRVGRADIDGDVVGAGPDLPQRREVVLVRGLVGDLFVAPDVDAQPVARASRLETLRGCGGTVIVETEAVQQRAVRCEPEEARHWVPRLRERGHRPHLNGAEAERPQTGMPSRLFVEAGGQSHGRLEVEPEAAYRQPWITHLQQST